MTFEASNLPADISRYWSQIAKIALLSSLPERVLVQGRFYRSWTWISPFFVVLQVCEICMTAKIEPATSPTSPFIVSPAPPRDDIVDKVDKKCCATTASLEFCLLNSISNTGDNWVSLFARRVDWGYLVVPARYTTNLCGWTLGINQYWRGFKKM